MPTLHIGLGVFKKIVDMMEDEANAIDAKIFHHRVAGDDSDSDDDVPLAKVKQHKVTNFDQAIEKRIKERQQIAGIIEHKEHQVEELLDNIPLAAIKRRNKTAVAKMLSEVADVRQEIAELVRSN